MKKKIMSLVLAVLMIVAVIPQLAEPAYAADPVYDITFHHKSIYYGEGDAGHLTGSSTDWEHPTWGNDTWVGSALLRPKVYYSSGNDHFTLKVATRRVNGAFQPEGNYVSGTVKYNGHTITFENWGPFDCGSDWVDIRFERTAITFDYNGGRNYNQNTNSITADYYWYNASNFSIVDTYNGKNFDIENQPWWKAYPPVSSNTIFDGWWTEPTGGTRITTEDITKLSGTMTLYAHWEPYHLVQLVGGTNVTPSRGRIDTEGHHDTEVVQGSAMEPVTFTANEGYHIDHNSIDDVMGRREGTDKHTQNGVTVERISDTQYVAYGTPTGQVHIWIPNGHKYENWTTTTAATCMTAGEKERVCKYDATIKETATIPIDSNAHSYKFNDFTWTGSDAEGYTAAKANYVCEHDASHTTSVDATISEEVTDPTCTEPGKTTYTATVAAEDSPDGEKHEESKDAKATDPTDHKWKFEGFTWTGNETDGYTAAVANYECANDPSHTTTADAAISNEVTDPTCTEGGKTTYTAMVTAADSPDGQEHSESKDAKATDPKEHDWGDPTYTWADDYSSVTVSRVCKNDETHVESETAGASSKVSKQPTCTEKGETTYTSAAFTNTAFTIQAKTVEDIDALGHKMTKTDQVDPSCTEAGTGAYWTCETCKKMFSDEDGKNEIQEPVVIPAAGHQYGPWEKIDDKQHQRVCEHDAMHIEKEDHTWDAGKVTKKATATAEGVKTYTCTRCEATKTEKIPKLKPTPGPAALGRPSVATVANIPKKSMAVSWSKVKGATGYRVAWRERGGKWKTKNVTGTKLNVTGLKKSRLYEFKVLATKKATKTAAARTSAYSAVKYRYFKAVRMRSVKAARKSAAARWTKDGSASGYIILCSTKKNMINPKQYTIKGKSRTSYTLKGLTKGKTYYVTDRPYIDKGGHRYYGVTATPRKVKAK